MYLYTFCNKIFIKIFKYLGSKIISILLTILNITIYTNLYHYPITINQISTVKVWTVVSSPQSEVTLVQSFLGILPVIILSLLFLL